MDRDKGIVVTPAEVQYEGLDAVLDNVQLRAGADRINTTLGVYEPVPDGQGRREPPLDVIGHGRLLDRPLWGRRELCLRSYQPGESDPDVRAAFAALPYPLPAVAPPSLRIDVPRQIVDACHRRGLGVSIQISPYTLPSLPGGQSAEQTEGPRSAGDRPIRIDGRAADTVLAGHGCLNNPNVRALGRARLGDALRRYPDVEAVHLDWCEYTAYFLEDCFTCFCDSCRQAAGSAGYDWDRIVRDCRELWGRLHRLKRADLKLAADQASHPVLLLGWLEQSPGVLDLLRFKAETVAGALAELRAEMDALRLQRVALGVRGFAPPWSLVTGLHPGIVGRSCQEVGCKLFTFHWPMIVRWYAESLLRWNPGLAEPEVIAAVRGALDLPSRPDEHRRRLTDYGMPLPDEPHLMTAESLRRKLSQAIALAGQSGVVVSAYVHSYRPAAELAVVLRAARESGTAGIWIQRYGYLSDEKLDVIRRTWCWR